MNIHAAMSNAHRTGPIAFFMVVTVADGESAVHPEPNLPTSAYGTRCPNGC